MSRRGSRTPIRAFTWAPAYRCGNVADVFTALGDLARKTPDQELRLNALACLLAAGMLKDEIDEVRAHRESERRRDTRRGELGMMPMFGEMHMIEVEACRLLCPALRTGNSQAAPDGWRWIAKQSWADDLKAAPVQKRFY